MRDALTDELNIRSVVDHAEQAPIIPAEVSPRAVITSVNVVVGAPVAAGDVVATANGRPLVLLPGEFPMFRALSLGMTGPDVLQLQTGLGAAGFGIPPAEAGRFGSGTARAWQRLYAEAGFEPATAPDAGGGAQLVIPLSEVLIAPTLPGEVAQIARVGDFLSTEQPLLTVAAGELVAEAEVEAGQAARLISGTRVVLSGPGDATREAKVAGVLETSAEGGTYRLQIAPDEPLPREWAGKSALARVVLEVVSEIALVVPTRAITTAADASTYVRKQTSEGAFERVEVRVLGELAGRAAVEPVKGATLAEGDRVRVA